MPDRQPPVSLFDRIQDDGEDRYLQRLGWQCWQRIVKGPEKGQYRGCRNWYYYKTYHIHRGNKSKTGLDGIGRHSLCPTCREYFGETGKGSRNAATGLPPYRKAVDDAMEELLFPWTVYIAVAAMAEPNPDVYVYVGCTQNYERRVNQHRSGAGSKPLGRLHAKQAHVVYALSLPEVCTTCGNLSEPNTT